MTLNLERAEAAERKLDVLTARADAYEAVLKHIAERPNPTAIISPIETLCVRRERSSSP